MATNDERGSRPEHPPHSWFDDVCGPDSPRTQLPRLRVVLVVRSLIVRLPEERWSTRPTRAARAALVAARLARVKAIAGAWLVSLSVLACGARTGLRVDAGESPIDVPAATDQGGIDVAREASLGICGDLVVQPGEDCDSVEPGTRAPAFGLQQVAGREVPTTILSGARSASDFYAYASASAHTGLESVGVASVFLYASRRDNDLSLVVIMGRDDMGEPVTQPESEVTMMLRGVPASARIAVSDDPGEVRQVGAGAIDAVWTFVQNTDGAVISGLPWDVDWEITLTPNFIRGVSSFQSPQARAPAIPLLLSGPVRLIHRARRVCLPGCRFAPCGDGYVDAGERCDDGNNVSNDGCSADCRRLD